MSGESVAAIAKDMRARKYCQSLVEFAPIRYKMAVMRPWKLFGLILIPPADAALPGRAGGRFINRDLPWPSAASGFEPMDKPGHVFLSEIMLKVKHISILAWLIGEQGHTMAT
jgi:hypothetical protein